MGLFWDYPRLSFGDLPTLQRLLEKADTLILAREVAQAAERDGGMTHKQARRLEKGARKAIAEMRRVEAKAPSKKKVIVGCRSFDWDAASQSIRAEAQSVLIRRADAVALAKLDIDDLQSAHVTPLDFSLAPWRKALAYRVWLGGAFSRRERYQVLADAIWEMTFFGWSEEATRKKQQKFLSELEKQLEDDSPGIPSDLALPRFGLEASTDDYESEHDAHMYEIVTRMNQEANEDFNERVASLGLRIACNL